MTLRFTKRYQHTRKVGTPRPYIQHSLIPRVERGKLRPDVCENIQLMAFPITIGKTNASVCRQMRIACEASETFIRKFYLSEIDVRV